MDEMDEQEILSSVEAGEWQSVPDVEQEKRRYQQLAQLQNNPPQPPAESSKLENLDGSEPQAQDIPRHR